MRWRMPLIVLVLLSGLVAWLIAGLPRTSGKVALQIQGSLPLSFMPDETMQVQLPSGWRLSNEPQAPLAAIVDVEGMTVLVETANQRRMACSVFLSGLSGCHGQMTLDHPEADPWGTWCYEYAPDALDAAPPPPAAQVDAVNAVVCGEDSFMALRVALLADGRLWVWQAR